MVTGLTDGGGGTYSVTEDPDEFGNTDWADDDDGGGTSTVTTTDSSDYGYSDPRTDPDNWDSDSGDSEDVTGGGVVDDDSDGSGWGDDDSDDSGSDNIQDSSDADEYLDDPRQDPTNWESDSGDASDVTGGGRVDPEDDEWAQAQEDPNAGVEEQINEALAEQRAAFEEDIGALMESLPVPDQLGGSFDGGGLTPAVGAVALLAVGGGALYYSEAT
jgi:hypothetical protein